MLNCCIMDQLLVVLSSVLLLLLLLLTGAKAERGQGEVFPECSVVLQHCVFEDNILDIINNVPSLPECRLLCQDKQDCRYLTYYYSGSDMVEPFAGSCILFSHCSLYPHTEDNSCLGCVTEDTQCDTVVEPCSAPVQGGPSTPQIQQSLSHIYKPKGLFKIHLII